MADKIISDLEAAPALTGDMLFPVENDVGTFAASLEDVAEYAIGEIPSASENESGIADIATQLEVDNGLDDEKIITPLKLRFGFQISLGTNGYIKFPSWLGGFVIQWGTNNISANTNSIITLPLAFPTVCLNVQATYKSNSSGLVDVGAANIVSVSQISLANGADSAINIMWWAFGY